MTTTTNREELRARQLSTLPDDYDEFVDSMSGGIPAAEEVRQGLYRIIGSVGLLNVDRVLFSTYVAHDSPAGLRVMERKSQFALRSYERSDLTHGANGFSAYIALGGSPVTGNTDARRQFLDEVALDTYLMLADLRDAGRLELKQQRSAWL